MSETAIFAKDKYLSKSIVKFKAIGLYLQIYVQTGCVFQTFLNLCWHKEKSVLKDQLM